MKLIEALKKEKDLARKKADIKALLRDNCAHSNMENPRYGDKQEKKVRGWLQSIHDLNKESLRLRIAVQKTNLVTNVTIELEGKEVTKTIAEWIHRRRDLAESDLSAWQCLTDRGVVEGKAKSPTGDMVEINVVRYFDPSGRDNKVMALSEEPHLIDAKLEIVNAVTDIIED